LQIEIVEFKIEARRSMNQQEMKERTKEYAKRILKLCRTLPQTKEGQLLSSQLFRAGTSVGANYRAACRARSKADFISKLGIVLEEADESLYWLEIITETKLIDPPLVVSLMKEGNEIASILVASINTSKRVKS
jgi:four helix bundle protein